MEVITGVKELPVLTAMIQWEKEQVGEASWQSFKAC